MVRASSDRSSIVLSILSTTTSGATTTMSLSTLSRNLTDSPSISGLVLNCAAEMIAKTAMQAAPASRCRGLTRPMAPHSATRRPPATAMWNIANLHSSMWTSAMVPLPLKLSEWVMSPGTASIEASTKNNEVNPNGVSSIEASPLFRERASA